MFLKSLNVNVKRLDARPAHSGYKMFHHMHKICPKPDYGGL